MKLLRIAAVAMVSVVFIAVPALGHPRTLLDADDSEGPLDTVAARHRHATLCWGGIGAGGCVTNLTFKLVTYETWGYEAIGGGKNFVSFEINLDDDELIERCAVVISQTPEGGEGQAALTYSVFIYEDCDYFDDRLVRSYETEHAGRHDAHSIRVRVPKKALLGRGSGDYRWRAVTSFEEQSQSSPCPAPDPHGDGGYGACADFTRWTAHPS